MTTPSSKTTPTKSDRRWAVQDMLSHTTRYPIRLLQSTNASKPRRNIRRMQRRFSSGIYP
eukprot:4691478-Pyramimonas_sp.AAC.1